MANKKKSSGAGFMKVIEWDAAGKILKRAAELINEKGWQQGAAEAVPEKCLATALEHAFREKEYSIVDFNYAREALSRMLHVPREPQPAPSDPLAVPYWGLHFMEWNDAPGRTKEEVVNALNAASALAGQLAVQTKN
jgi:hypothetical protein